jgi:hypothetical protein
VGGGTAGPGGGAGAAGGAPAGASKAAGGPLDEAQYALVQEAAGLYRPIKRAARTALGSAIVTLVIGATAAPLLLVWPSLAGAFITVGLGVIGVVEFLGSRKMRQADPAAARQLALNQVAFLGLIVLYCVAQMLSFSAEDWRAAAMSPEFREQLQQAMPEMARSIDRDIEQWAPLATYGFYSLVIVLSIFFQGGMALYYYTRLKHLEAFHSRTPPWVRRLLLESAADLGR